MKTFEERYTAWIDGELEGNALVAFEQELARRATVQEAGADKADAMHLSTFLHEYLQAPALTNEDFFNHQLRERIAGERAATRRPEAGRSPEVSLPWFSWSLSRLGILGAACLFISGALYYGMIPKENSNGAQRTPTVALNDQNAVQAANPGNSGTGAAQDGGAPSANSPADRNGPTRFVKLTKEQEERVEREQDLLDEQERQQHARAVIEPGADIQARVPDQTVPATATPLHYKDSNVNVLWVNGLDYLPDASALDGANTPAAANPAPAVTATP